MLTNLAFLLLQFCLKQTSEKINVIKGKAFKHREYQGIDFFITFPIQLNNLILDFY